MSFLQSDVQPEQYNFKFLIEETEETGEYDGCIGIFGDILDSIRKAMNPVTGRPDKHQDVFHMCQSFFDLPKRIK